MPHLSIRIDFDQEGRLGPGKVALLERIASEGSISAAGRSMNMSYKRAWELVAEINQSFTEPLVTRTDRRQDRRRRGADAARRRADPPLPRHRTQGALGHRLAPQGLAGDFPQPTAEITRYPRRSGRIRHGEDKSPQGHAERCADQGRVHAARPRALRRPGLRCRCRTRSPRSSKRRGTATTSTASRRARRRAGPRFADPDLRALGRLAQGARRRRPRRAAAEIGGVDARASCW